jgi:hypothetical protein
MWTSAEFLSLARKYNPNFGREIEKTACALTPSCVVAAALVETRVRSVLTEFDVRMDKSHHFLGFFPDPSLMAVRPKSRFGAFFCR